MSDIFFIRYAKQSLKIRDLEAQISLLLTEIKNLKSELQNCHASIDVLQNKREHIPPSDIITTDLNGR